MKNCTWTIDGKDPMSKEELDNYILSSKYYKETVSDVVFSKSAGSIVYKRFEKITNEATERSNKYRESKLSKNNLAKEKKLYDSLSRKIPQDEEIDVYGDDFIGVSDYIFSRGLISDLNIQHFKEFRTAQFENAMRNFANPNFEKDNTKLQRKQAENPNWDKNQVIAEVIDDEIASWQYVRKTGKVLDSIFGIVLNKRQQLDRHYWDGEHFNVKEYLKVFNEHESLWYDLEGLIDEDGNSKLIDSFIKQALEVKNQLHLKSGEYPDYQVDVDYMQAYSEKGIRGKIDIVVVRNDGSIDIYDIKTSSRRAGGLDINMSDWDRDKIKSTKYQLELYKRILQANGLTDVVIRTNIIPIFLDGVQYNSEEDSTLENIIVENPIDVQIDDDIVTTIMGQIPIKYEKSIDSEIIKQAIEKDLEKVFPSISLADQLVTIDEDYLFRTKTIRKLPGGKWGFDMNKNSALKEPATFETREAALAAYHKEYAKEKAVFTDKIQERVNLLKEKLKKFNDGAGFNFDTDELFDKRKGPNEFRRYFSESGWSMLEDEHLTSALRDLGIVVLINDTLNPNYPIIDVINMTDTYLDKDIKFKLGNTIFGQFKLDKHTDNAPKATIGNVLLYRNMIAANIVAKSIPNAKFGNIVVSKVVGLVGGNRPHGMKYDAAMLEDNFRKLALLGNIENNLSHSNFLTNEESLYYMFTTIKDEAFLARNGITFNKNLKNIYDAFESSSTFGIYGQMSGEQRIEFITKLTDLWRALNEHYKFETKENLITGLSFEHYMYREIARIVTENARLYMDINNIDPLTEWGWEGNWRERIAVKHDFLNSAQLNTIDTIPIVSAIHERLQKDNQLIRDDYSRYKSPALDKWFKSVGLSNNITSMQGSGRFYDTTERGKELFLFKDPETDTTLNAEDKKFLREYLLKINTLKLNREPTDDDKQSVEYLEVPLLRASDYSRLVNYGVFNTLKRGKENVERYANDTYNIANRIHPEGEKDYREVEDYRDIIKMYELFGMSSDSRAKALEKVDDPASAYEMNLEHLLDSYTHAKITEKRYNKSLPIISAAIYTLQTEGYHYGVDVQSSHDFIIKHLKSAVFNESLLPRNIVVNTAMALKGETSKLILGFNILSGGKEVLNGIYYHYSRAAAHSLFDKDKIGLADITKAYTDVWIDSFKQTAMNTLQEKLNVRFGMSNMSIDNMVEAQNYWRTSTARFKSMMFWANRAPDFLNRMTVLNGYLHKYGAQKAYHVDEVTEELIYNWKDDDRFSLLSGNKSNSKEYLEQLSLYSKMMEDFVDQGKEVYDKKTNTLRPIRWDANKGVNHPDNDQLPDAFTNKQVMSIRHQSDMAFGYMDNDTKALVNKEGIASVFLQFKTFISARKQQWFATPGKNDIGGYKHGKNIKDELLYELPVKQEDGTYNIEHVTTPTAVVEGQTVNLKPVTIWEGSFSEGIFWSVFDLLISTKGVEGYKEAWSDPVKRANALIAFEELMILLMLLWLTKGVYGGAKEISKLDNFLERNALVMINSSSQDLRWWNNIIYENISLDFQVWDYVTKMVPDFGAALFNLDNASFYKFAAQNLGATSMVRKDLWDLHHNTQR